MTRPAETTAAGGSIALLAGVVLGVDDPETIALIGAAIGLLPAMVTTLVNAGGVRGALRSLWKGRTGE